MPYSRPTPRLLTAFLLALATLIGLGVWQLERLVWKEQLIEQIKTGNAEEPVTVLPEVETELAPLTFHHVTLTGQFVPGIEFHVTPRYFRDTLGYHLFTPFALSGPNAGRIVIVNRGWVPAEKKDPATRPETLAGMEEHALTGQIRLGPERNYFTPKNDPKANIWFGRDVAEMVKTTNLTNVLPITVDILGPQNPAVLPIPAEGVIGLRNDHLQYALTWFLLALGLVGVFAVYHRK